MESQSKGFRGKRGVSEQRASTTAVRPGPNGKVPAASAAEKREDPILFQQYFKSVGPRTYASQIKESRNGNHYLILTEGKRDPETEQIRKTRLFIYSEDFSAFFRLLHETAVFIRENPVPEAVRRKREAYWRKQNQSGGRPAAIGNREVSPRRREDAKARRNDS